MDKPITARNNLAWGNAVGGITHSLKNLLNGYPQVLSPQTVSADSVAKQISTGLERLIY